jgi:density-regulated protein
VTSIGGLEGYGLKLKEVASALGKKFGAGASVVKTPEGKQEVDVQGDLSYDLPEVLSSLYGIPEDAIIVRD